MFKDRKKNHQKYLNEYKKSDSDVAFYNLPKKVEFCKTCLMSNQKPIQTIEHMQDSTDHKTALEFNNGICYACLHRDKKKDVDWEEKKFEFIKLLDKYRSRNGSYDIVVPGSGGKDSFKVAHELKYTYGMNPITCTFAPNMYTSFGYKNLINWIDAGFSNYNFTLDGKIHRQLTRLCFDNLLHPLQTWIMGQKAFPNRFASMMKIPLVIYGENPREYDQGTKDKEYTENVLHDIHTRKEGDDLRIAGYQLDELKSKLKLTDSDLAPYMPLTTEQQRESKIKTITYSYFHNWHQQGNYYYTRDNSSGFTLSPDRTPGTYSKYVSLDDKIDDLYYYTCYIKFGVGRAHYDASQEIRAGDIEIEEARQLIRRYSGEFPKRFMKEMCEWLTLDPKEFPDAKALVDEAVFTEDYFLELCDTFRSPHLFKLEDGKYKLRKQV